MLLLNDRPKLRVKSYLSCLLCESALTLSATQLQCIYSVRVVDINTIRAWLGHVSLDTTHVYAEIDLEMKAKALAQCEVPASASDSIDNWSNNPELMSFLKSL